jgi:hypothetical protein
MGSRCRRLLVVLSAAAGIASAAASCSSDGLRDQHYGTDAGANYKIPDAKIPDAATAGTSADASPDADAGDAGADAGESGN